MITWMLLSALAGGVLAGAGLAAEQAARLLGRPRRWGWVAAMLLAVVLPVVVRWLPARPATAGGEAVMDGALLAQLLAASVGDPVPSTSQQFSGALADLTATTLWIALSAAMAMSLLVACLRLRRIRAAAEPIHFEGFPALLSRGSGPMVVGVRRPAIVLPRWIEEADADERRLVMRHEWEHARSRDPLLLLIGAVLVAAMPWNLSLWWMRRRLRQGLEVDCDARVLAAGADRRAYGAMLIRTAGRPGPAPLLAPALIEVPSLLERRIVAMTTRIPAYARARAAAAGIAAVLLLVAACEMTPRGSGLTPTEPTMADVLAPVAEDVTVITVVDFDVDDPAASLNSEGNVLVARIGPDGDTLWTEGTRIRAPLTADGVEGNPIYILNGERVASIEGVDPQTVLTVDVLKGATAVALYGEDAADGVIQIRTGDRGARSSPDGAAAAEGDAAQRTRVRAVAAGEATVLEVPLIRATDGSAAKPLFMVDGERVESIEGIDPATIERIEVIKSAEAAARYGADAREGVVIVTLKR